MLRLLSVSLIALAALALTACGARQGESAPAAPAASDGTLRIGVKVDTPPFGTLLGGQNAGFDIDLALAVASEMGRPDVTFVPVTSADRIPRLVAGEIDLIIASMTITRRRDQQIDFSLPYFLDGQGLLVAESSEIESYRDLSGRKVGTTAGSTSAGNLAQVTPDAEVVEVADFAALQAALIAGDVEAITTDTTILLGLARRLEGDWRLAGAPFSTEPYGIGMRENDSDLRDAVNEALQSLWESGDLQLLHQAWFGPGTAYADLPPFSMTPYPR